MVMALPLNATAATPRKALDHKWYGTPRTVEVDCSALGTLFKDSAQAAMNTWNNVKLTNGQSIVTFKAVNNTSLNTAIFYASLDDGQIAYTYTNHPIGDPAVRYSEIQLSKSKTFVNGRAAGAYDIQSVILHELGHSLGVAHCHEYYESCSSSTCNTNVMNLTIPTNYTRRSLTYYDYQSYQQIYSY